MWTRKELKTNAKGAFRRNYWKCVLVAFILMLLVGGSSAGSSSSVRKQLSGNNAQQTENLGQLPSLAGEETAALEKMVSMMLPIVIAVVLIAAAFSIALGILVSAPFEVGGCRFFLVNARDMAPVGEVMFGFQGGHYWNTVKIQFFRGLYTTLWTLLLIVPGIIKTYQYYMIPYILADDPQISREEAFHLSNELMRGNKWNVFVLDLSFFGWDILNAFTLGVLGIFWVNPYRHATRAELYLELKKEYYGNTCQTFEKEVY